MSATNALAYSDNRKVLIHWLEADDETNEDSETNEDDEAIEGEDYPGVDLGPML